MGERRHQSGNVPCTLQVKLAIDIDIDEAMRQAAAGASGCGIARWGADGRGEAWLGVVFSRVAVFVQNMMATKP